MLRLQRDDKEEGRKMNNATRISENILHVMDMVRYYQKMYGALK